MRPTQPVSLPTWPRRAIVSNGIPYNTTWQQTTLETISTSLENFGFGALYHKTGPPYDLEVPILEELRSLSESSSFASDFEFQENLQTIMTSLLDAHTRYSKPGCYSATLVMPVAFDFQLDEARTNSGALQSEPSAYLIESAFYEQYTAAFPDLDLSPLWNQPVTLINGLETVTAISTWGATHESRSNNAGARFNAALRSFLYRSAISTQVGDAPDALVVTMADGSEVSLPWLVAYNSNFGITSACEKLTQSTETEAEAESEKQKQLPSLTRQALLLVNDGLAEGVLTHAELHDDRPDRNVIISPEEAQFEISCFTQKTGSEKALVMKVASFSPNAPTSNGTYIDAWTGFLSDAATCLDQAHDLIVVDVMQNGGGYVCLGLRLLELLVEDYFYDHTKVQMKYDLPHSHLMDNWIRVVNNPDPYIDPDLVEQILNPATQEPFVDGDAYYYPGRNVTMGGVQSWRTNWFCLNCKEAEVLPTGYTPKKFMSPDRLVILSDGTCGSTCASFTRIAQEAGVATFIGAGGLWKEEMDVASFAGGFVCNPDYLTTMAEMSGLPPFPNFITNQRWQFGWAAWYSQILPTRPVQFISQEPGERKRCSREACAWS